MTAAGKSLQDIITDNLEIVSKTAREGWKIYNRKGTKNFGIATSFVEIIKVILHDENKIIPISTLLEGEYGQSDEYAGIPGILNRTGVSDIL